MSTVPKSRISRSKRGMRRSHLRIRKFTLNTCPNCKSAVQPHKLCLSCGWYKGRQVVASRVENT
ncbi:MAG: 50S ribosomal protein L32 [Bdellovibrionales bacterium]|nr:50S ribosomal protein L32 [Bdellovibrionales bacterium]